MHSTPAINKSCSSWFSDWWSQSSIYTVTVEPKEKSIKSRFLSSLRSPKFLKTLKRSKLHAKSRIGEMSIRRLSAEESLSLYSLLKAEHRPLNEILADFNTSVPRNRHFTLCSYLVMLLQATLSFWTPLLCSFYDWSVFLHLISGIGSLGF